MVVLRNRQEYGDGYWVWSRALTTRPNYLVGGGGGYFGAIGREERDLRAEQPETPAPPADARRQPRPSSVIIFFYICVFLVAPPPGPPGRMALQHYAWVDISNPPPPVGINTWKDAHTVTLMKWHTRLWLHRLMCARQLLFFPSSSLY